MNAEQIASECFQQYRERYHQDTKILVPPWDELPYDVKSRWIAALEPVADRLKEAALLALRYENLQRRHKHLLEDETTAVDQITKLREALNAADLQVLDGIALQSVPPAVVELMDKLASFIGRSQTVTVRVWTGEADAKETP